VPCLRIGAAAVVAVPRGGFPAVAGEEEGRSLPGLRSPGLCRTLHGPADSLARGSVTTP